MRDLTSEEMEILDRRRKGFDSFLEERMPVLTDFMQKLELPNPALVLIEAGKYLPALDEWLKDQVVEPSDKTWICTRLGYFVGEYLVQRFGGCWFLNELPDSRYFGHYVVGHFSQTSNPRAMVSPFVAADVCIAEPPGRSLLRLLTTVEQELVEA